MFRETNSEKDLPVVPFTSGCEWSILRAHLRASEGRGHRNPTTAPTGASGECRPAFLGALLSLRTMGSDFFHPLP